MMVSIHAPLGARHPHRCGEQKGKASISINLPGSSPITWGTDVVAINQGKGSAHVFHVVIPLCRATEGAAAGLQRGRQKAEGTSTKKGTPDSSPPCCRKNVRFP